MVYYQPGIGTYTSPLLTAAPFVNGIAKTLDEMVAWNLGVHVMEGYNFLMQNCKLYHASPDCLLTSCQIRRAIKSAYLASAEELIREDHAHSYV